jgi:hypothetical protein
VRSRGGCRSVICVKQVLQHNTWRHTWRHTQAWGHHMDAGVHTHARARHLYIQSHACTGTCAMRHDMVETIVAPSWLHWQQDGASNNHYDACIAYYPLTTLPTSVQHRNFSLYFLVDWSHWTKVALNPGTVFDSSPHVILSWPQQHALHMLTGHEVLAPWGDPHDCAEHTGGDVPGAYVGAISGSIIDCGFGLCTVRMRVCEWSSDSMACIIALWLLL